MADSNSSVLSRWRARLPSRRWVDARRGRLSLLALLLVAGLLGWWSDDLPRIVLVAIWAAFLVVCAFLLRFRGMNLFGPVFFYDIIRSARRSNFAALRSFYAGALLVVLFMVYSSVVRTQGSTFWESLWQPGTVPRHAVAGFGEKVFYTFVAVQFGAVLLLTPVCAAGAITEEKERRTLEFVLVTDLADREVISGKLASRMAYLVLFVLTGLPILSMLQFMGGVAPDLVIASFIMTGMTMLSLAGVSVAISVFANKTRGAVLLTYLVAISYLLISSCCCVLPVDWLTAGNFLIAVRRLFDSSVSVEDNLPWVLIEYSSFHLLAATGCYLWAAVNLRARGVRQPANMMVLRESDLITGPSRRAPVERKDTAAQRSDPQIRARQLQAIYAYPQAELPVKPRPRIGDQPILWKELYAEPFFRPGPAGQTLIMVFGVMGLLMGGYVLLLGMAAAASSSSLGTFTNLLGRYFGTGLAFFMILGIGLRAAGTLTSERDRQTLDSLLTTLLENRSILFGKWLGSILGVRKGFFLLAPIWVLGVLAGGVHPLAFLLLVLGWFVFAAFEAGLGMWLSLVCRNTLVASVATILTTLGLCACPWAAWSLYISFMYQNTTPGHLASIEKFVVFGLTPPVTLGTLGFRSEDFELKTHPLTGEMVMYAVYGVGLYAAAAAILWQALLWQFPRNTGRMPVGRTGVVPPAQQAEPS